MACLGVAAIGAAACSGRASSHREAPLISQDPLADNTDLYVRQPDDAGQGHDHRELHSAEAPYGGPNFTSSTTVTYAIKIDNNGDAREDVTYQFRFKTSVANGNTFLYNTGPIHLIDSANWNVRQSYTVARASSEAADWAARRMLGKDGPPPVNIGIRSTPNYDALRRGCRARISAAASACSLVQRDDPVLRRS
jgi:hypothetical protein